MELAIGTKWIHYPTKKVYRDVNEIVDIYKTYNSNGDLVSLVYISVQDCNGQPLRFESSTSTITRSLFYMEQNKIEVK